MSASLHDEAELWAATAAAGGLTDPESQAWSDHRKDCPACQKLHTEEMTMSTLLQRTLGPESPDPGFEQRLIHRLEQARLRRENRWSEFLLFHPALALLATCLAALAIVGALLWTGGHRAADGNAVVQIPPAETTAKQIATQNGAPTPANTAFAPPGKVEVAMKSSPPATWSPDDSSTPPVALDLAHRHPHRRHPHRHHRHHHHPAPTPVKTIPVGL